MKMRTLFIINAVIQFFFGVGFMFAPAVLLGLFGTHTDTTGTTLAHVAVAKGFTLTVNLLWRISPSQAAHANISHASNCLSAFLGGHLFLLHILNLYFL